MDYKEMLGAAQTVWDNLDKLQRDDPGKYEVHLKTMLMKK